MHFTNPRVIVLLAGQQVYVDPKYECDVSTGTFGSGPMFVSVKLAVGGAYTTAWIVGGQCNWPRDRNTLLSCCNTINGKGKTYYAVYCMLFTMLFTAHDTL